MATDPPNLHGGPQIPPQDNSKPFIRSPYNYDWKQASDATAIAPGGPSLTVQSQTEDTDLNILLKRFGVTGGMPVNPRLPQYGDFSDITDFRSALAAIDRAEDTFLQFPADIRAQFENNAQLFLDFVENPANVETVKKWFPQENVGVNQNNPGGNAPPQSSAPTPQSGSGATAGDGGAGVSK